VPHSIISPVSRSGFTLLEVNLAIFIMAVGMLGMCALYSLGFRESRQSVEDVAAAAYADAYLGPLVQGLSATNMPWSSWRQIGDSSSGQSKSKKGSRSDVFCWPQEGWGNYVDAPKETTGTKGFAYRERSGPRARADSVYGQILGKVPSEYKGTRPGISSDYQYALVVTRIGATIQLAFRIARRKDSLMSQPLFVSEVHFQGDPER